MKVLHNKRILIISTEPWRHNFVSKHHYAIHLANHGNTVFFLNPPTEAVSLSGSGYRNLFVIDYRPTVRGSNRLPSVMNKFLQAMDVKKIMSIAQSEFDIVWSFDPYRFQFPQLFSAKINIYYAADRHANRQLEQLLAKNVHLVVSPSRSVLEQIDTQTPKHFLNHAVADHFFDEQVRSGIPGRNSVKVGYVGNLQSKYLNYLLLEKVIEENQGCDFVFAGDAMSGPITNVARQENVYFLGPLNNELVPAFLRACDILLLCYDTQKFRVEASNSHKIMEYLASGRVIVSTTIDEYKKYPDLIIAAESDAVLPHLLTEVASDLKRFNGQLLRDKRINFARDHTYTKQLLRLDSWIDEIDAKLIR